MRSLLASAWSGPRSSRQLSGWSAGSASSMNNQPPGRRAATMASRAGWRSVTCTRTRRACTRSNSPSGAWVGRHVVPPHLHRWAGIRRRRPRHVDVGGQDIALGPHPVGQEPHHRRTARPHLPTTPTRGQAERRHVAERRRVEQCAEGGEPGPGCGCGVIEEVAPALVLVLFLFLFLFLFLPASSPSPVIGVIPGAPSRPGTSRRSGPAPRPLRPGPRRSWLPCPRSPGTAPKVRRHR